VWLSIALFLCFLPIMILAERFRFDPEVAFVVFGVGVLLISIRNLTLNCPKCGKNVFTRGVIFAFWPSRTCRKCGRELDETPQNR